MSPLLSEARFGGRHEPAKKHGKSLGSCGNCKGNYARPHAFKPEIPMKHRLWKATTAQYNYKPVVLSTFEIQGVLERFSSKFEIKTLENPKVPVF